MNSLLFFVGEKKEWILFLKRDVQRSFWFSQLERASTMAQWVRGWAAAGNPALRSATNCLSISAGWGDPASGKHTFNNAPRVPSVDTALWKALWCPDIARMGIKDGWLTLLSPWSMGLGVCMTQGTCAHRTHAQGLHCQQLLRLRCRGAFAPCPSELATFTVWFVLITDEQWHFPWRLSRRQTCAGSLLLRAYH